ncbi:hypothetical protein [Xanthomonas phage NEB7]|nr:hypothetical protein [Xanthomonas phage NEB7]
MSIPDHTAILLYSALAAPEKNKLKADDAPLEYYAVVAFPPEAQSDLVSAMTAVSESGQLAGHELAPKLNSSMAKPTPGIPDNWLIARMSSQYAPELYLDSGEALAATPLNTTRIKTEFFSGQHVRVNANAYSWFHKKTNRRGISLGLLGLMSVGGGERRAGGNDSAEAFGVRPGQTPAAQPAAPASQPAAAAAAAAPANANPFAQGTAAQSGNPFAAR